MKPLLVLAGNQREYMRWVRFNQDVLEAAGLAPRYLPANSINHLGYKDCLYVEVGTYYRSSKQDEMYHYFESHKITPLKI